MNHVLRLAIKFKTSNTFKRDITTIYYSSVVSSGGKFIVSFFFI